MTAKEALEKYGYRLVDGVYVRFLGEAPDLTTERWKPVEGGFECYKTATPGFGGVVWGRDVGGGLAQVPWTPTEHYAGVGGLHPAVQLECFEWVWPEEVVAFQYQYAGQEGWRRLESGEMVREK